MFKTRYTYQLLLTAVVSTWRCDASFSFAVFVDTNQWYHTTFIHEGALSITIGSEYD